mgnify:CR=1 FL=1
MAVHKHWTIIGYTEKVPNPAGGYFFNYMTEISVDADSEEEALKKAKATLKRPYYHTQRVIDCEIDHGLHQDLQTEAIATQRLMLKELMKHKEG